MLSEGNRLKKAERGYSIDKEKRLFDAIKKLSYSAVEPSRRLIFIVGMPRSGTSLVEQILASHSTVHAAGELTAMAVLCLSGKDPRGVRDGYLKGIPDAAVVTDKMPANFMWIGVILSAFPDAKIVHTSRDPMATCWSIYKTSFTGSGNRFAHDLQDIAKFYKLYRDLMAFWRERFPGKIHDLNYEELTVNQEPETRALLDYCELPWEDACLRFHENPRPVRTASSAQVRKPMYQGSSRDWKRYEKHLTPLKEALGV
jgi:hypothetical protein